jgi:hypothetical protein
MGYGEERNLEILKFLRYFARSVGRCIVANQSEEHGGKEHDRAIRNRDSV